MRKNSQLSCQLTINGISQLSCQLLSTILDKLLILNINKVDKLVNYQLTAVELTKPPLGGVNCQLFNFLEFCFYREKTQPFIFPGRQAGYFNFSQVISCDR
jgi:hypothetical protein